MSHSSNNPDDDHNVTYEKFWKEIVEKNGVLDLDQVKRELHDFKTLMGSAAEVYMHITNGRISKVNTTADAVIGEANDCAQQDINDAVREAQGPHLRTFYRQEDGSTYWLEGGRLMGAATCTNGDRDMDSVTPVDAYDDPLSEAAIAEIMAALTNKITVVAGEHNRTLIFSGLHRAHPDDTDTLVVDLRYARQNLPAITMAIALDRQVLPAIHAAFAR